jgi:two-component system sensor histidine kinase QseC
LASRFATDALPAELTPISSRLNDLLTRLEQSFERERRFSADLAHELRTPIAELRALAELALKWPETRDGETDRDVLAAACQMEGIVTRLLALLRSERGQLAAVRERVELSPMIENVWKPFLQKAAEKKLHFSFGASNGAEVQTDPVLLRSILTNLVDNAVEYTPAGGTVRIESKVEHGDFTVTVGNTVEQFTPDDLSRLFDRFWRKDAARSSSDHSGLGLSLARAFASAMGGDLTAALEDSRLVFRFRSTGERQPAESS